MAAAIFCFMEMIINRVVESSQFGYVVEQKQLVRHKDIWSVLGLKTTKKMWFGFKISAYLML